MEESKAWHTISSCIFNKRSGCSLLLGIPTACRFAGPKLSLIKLLFSSSNLMPESLPTFPKRCAKIFHHPFTSFPAHTPSKALDLPPLPVSSETY